MMKVSKARLKVTIMPPKATIEAMVQEIIKLAEKKKSVFTNIYKRLFMLKAGVC